MQGPAKKSKVQHGALRLSFQVGILAWVARATICRSLSNIPGSLLSGGLGVGKFFQAASRPSGRLPNHPQLLPRPLSASFVQANAWDGTVRIAFWRKLDPHRALTPDPRSPLSLRERDFSSPRFPHRKIFSTLNFACRFYCCAPLPKPTPSPSSDSKIFRPAIPDSIRRCDEWSPRTVILTLALGIR